MARAKQKTANKKHRTAHSKGLLAETVAVWFLRVKGYRILARRYKSRFGEIDIIAARKQMIVFIEVKTRKNRNDALCAVTHNMRMRIEKAAQDYIARHRTAEDKILRFDFIALAPPFFIRHLDNAWRPAT